MKGSLGRLILVLIVISLSPPIVIAESPRIGVSAPLSGTTASWGKDILNGITFANAELAGGRYELIDGTFGKWSFDSDGDIQGVPFVMKRIVNNQIVTITE